MAYTVEQIAVALGAEAVGDLSIVINSVSEPADAVSGQLSLAMEPKYTEALAKGSASAAVVWPDADWQSFGLKAAIYAPRSRYLLSGVSYLFERAVDIASGVHPTSIVDPSATIGADAAVGPFCVIGAGVEIGSNVRMVSHCVVGAGARIGNYAMLHSGVRIGDRVEIGDRFISQSGAMVGADGFSYVTPQPGSVEEARKTGQVTQASRTDGFERINSLGAVTLGHDVELGANCAIDRGTIANTRIGNGTKVDNLVHIGHNVTIGETCLICGQVGIAGSSVIGDRVVLGGQVGVADHISIGSDVIAAGKSGISSNVPSGRVIMGNPAMKMDLNIESYKALRRLPRLFAKVAKLEKTVSKSDET